MALRKADGSLVTRAAFPSTKIDEVHTVNETLYETYEVDPYKGGPRDGIANRQVKYRAGEQILLSDVARAIPAATVDTVTPATGPTAGGTTVILKGTNLAGIPSLTVGGAAATGVTVIDGTTLRFVTPAGTAGAKNIVLADDAGSLTVTNGFTYA